MGVGLLIVCCVSIYCIYPNLNHFWKRYQHNHLVVSLQHIAALLSMCLVLPGLNDQGYGDHPPFFPSEGVWSVDVFIGGIMLSNCIWHNIVLDGTVIFLAEKILRPTVT